jgi:methyltransferase (TIGR00027 family)
LAKEDVAKTALFVAAVRARENERHNRLFRDDLSSLLAGGEGLAWLEASQRDPASKYRPDGFPYLEVRTRYFDDWALEAVQKSEATQLVLLGAGMDTRAFRLPWPPSLRFFEIDIPGLFALKEARLQSAGVMLACDRVVVKADLTSRSWGRSLLRLGFDESKPTVWLAEGLFQYLAAADVKQILDAAASISPAGSRFGAEIISKEFLQRGSNQWILRRRKDRGTPWVFGIDDPNELFRSRGWKVDKKVDCLDVARALGRWQGHSAGPSRRSKGDSSGVFFVSATKALPGRVPKRPQAKRLGT